MRDVGRAMAIIGAVGFLGALFLMPTTVSTGSYASTEVFNLGLQQRQSLVAAACLAVFLAGVVLVAAGSIIDALEGPKALAALAAGVTSEDDTTTMARLGIVRVGTDYQAGGYLYRNLAAAVKATEAGKH